MRFKGDPEGCLEVFGVFWVGSSKYFTTEMEYFCPGDCLSFDSAPKEDKYIFVEEMDGSGCAGPKKHYCYDHHVKTCLDPDLQRR